jgi:predicted transcriptional regulator
MEVHLSPDLQAKLAQLASQQGRESEALVVEAVQRMVNYDEWFIREVEKGIAAADRGEFIKLEALRQDIREGIESGPARPLGVDEIKRLGRAARRR